MRRKDIKTILIASIAFFFISFSYNAKVIAQSKYIKLCKEGVASEISGKLDEAILKYNEAIALKPSNSCAYSCKASACYLKGEYTDAVTNASQAITISPKSPYAYMIRGGTYIAKKTYDLAISDFTSAISKHKKADYYMLASYIKRAQAYYYNKQYDLAITDFTKCIELSTAQNLADKYLLYDWRGHSYIRSEKYAEAIGDMTLYLASDPDNLVNTFYLGYAYFKNGDSEKAKSTAEKLIEMDPSKELNFKGAKILDIYDLDKRRKITKSLLEDANSNLAKYKLSSSVSLGNSLLKKAFHSLDSAWFYASGIKEEDRDIKDTLLSKLKLVYTKMTDKPELPELARKYMVQAGAATEEKNYVNAMKLWNKGISIAPYYPLAYYNRALLYELQGNYQSAIDDMNKYIEFAPDASDARSAQDKIYAWEAKVTKAEETATPNSSEAGLLNKIIEESYDPGKYYVELSIGGGLGGQIMKNESLADFYDAHNVSDKVYTETSHLLTGADVELVIKPIKFIGIGAFYKTLGGIGSFGPSSTYHSRLEMPCNQIGGLIRGYLMNGNGFNKLDLYLQYQFATSNLNGHYGFYGSDYLATSMMNLSASGPYSNLSFGFGGKIGRIGYLTGNIDYVSINYEKIKYRSIQDDDLSLASFGPVGTSGTLMHDGENVSANYKGFMFRMMLGFCF